MYQLYQKEGSAWEIGFNEMAKAGFKLDYDSKQYQFVRKCMSSYIGGEYDDVTILNETLKEHTLRHKIDMRLEEAWRKNEIIFLLCRIYLNTLLV